MTGATPMRDGEWRGWHLAIQVLGEIGVPLSVEQGHRMWDVVQEVADGRLTLVSSPGEITNRFPEADPEFVEGFARSANMRVAKDREVAQRLLRTMNDVLGNMGRRPDDDGGSEP